MNNSVTFTDFEKYGGVKTAALTRKGLISFLTKIKNAHPPGTILYYDADKAPLRELIGGPHKFNHAILSPQYQRNADGSYSNVGAKPAVDVFDGKKWLRSCGAVTNLLPGGFPLSPSNTTRTEEDQYTLFFRNDTTVNSPSWNVIGNPNSICTARIVARAAGTQVRQDTIDLGFYTTAFIASVCSIESGPGVISEITAGSSYRISGMSVNEDTVITLKSTSAITVSCVLALYPGSSWTGFLGGCRIKKTDCIVTATTYPVPYVPPGVTQPASNATTTNGSWFALPDGSPVWQALTGGPLTLATRVRMGVGSGNITNGEWPSIIYCGANRLQNYGRKADGVGAIINSYDGVSYRTFDSEWPRNSIIRRVTQVNTAGTQYRVGYMIEGTHATIQWSSWVNYDGSFGPSTLYRLMLGYNNVYPMWFSRISVWKEQVSDERILEALNG